MFGGHETTGWVQGLLLSDGLRILGSGIVDLADRFQILGSGSSAFRLRAGYSGFRVLGLGFRFGFRCRVPLLAGRLACGTMKLQVSLTGRWQLFFFFFTAVPIIHHLNLEDSGFDPSDLCN